jgi:hypothetical protein
MQAIWRTHPLFTAGTKPTSTALLFGKVGKTYRRILISIA